ncbi:MAG: hypothetical protein IKR39_11955 [Lachnospiraceae bacterium]|nr:hypothetical protein [Lachnospiraceae bacterium]
MNITVRVLTSLKEICSDGIIESRALRVEGDYYVIALSRKSDNVVAHKI